MGSPVRNAGLCHQRWNTVAWVCFPTLFTWCILFWCFFLIKWNPNQVLFETTNTMNAPSVSSVGTGQTSQSCKSDLLVLGVFGTACSSVCSLPVDACLVPSCCRQWCYCVVSPHVHKYQPSPPLPRPSLPLYSDVKNTHIYIYLYRYIHTHTHNGTGVFTFFIFFPFAAFAGQLGVISFYFLEIVISPSVAVADIRCTVCSGLARTAEPARRAGVVSVLLSTYL